MKSIMTTYPGFHSLPRGIKKLLLESETFFFSEPRGTQGKTGNGKFPFMAMIRASGGPSLDRRFPAFTPSWRN